MEVNTRNGEMIEDKLDYSSDKLEPSQIWVGFTPQQTGGTTQWDNLAGKEQVNMDIGDSSHTPYALLESFPATEAVYSKPFPAALASPAYSIPSLLVLRLWEQKFQVTPNVLGLITNDLGANDNNLEGSFGFEHLGINHAED